MRIIGPPSATRALVADRLANTLKAAPLFLFDIVPELWRASAKYGVDPIGVIAQSYKETSGGRFTGNVKPFFKNTAGIKVQDKEGVRALLQALNPTGPPVSDDHALMHSQFASWQIGAEAQVQHLLAYAGQLFTYMVVDPRYILVKDRWLENFEELGGIGSWAPSPTYGQEIVAIARKLQS